MHEITRLRSLKKMVAESLPISGFNGIVTFSVTGAPAGLTTGFSPTTVTGSGSSTLTLTATAVAAGIYPLTVKGTSGTLTHSATTFTLTVNLGGALSVNASPASIKVSRSATSPSVTNTIKVTISNGFLGPVTLTATGLPSGATATFTPSSVNVAPGSTGSSTLKVTVTPTTSIGKSNITVTAKSTGGPQAQTKVSLQVNK